MAFWTFLYDCYCHAYKGCYAPKKSQKYSIDINYYRGSITVVIELNNMAGSKTHRLGDLQLQIMKVLWEKGEGTVADVHGAVGSERNLAYTTVATMLRKMEAR